MARSSHPEQWDLTGMRGGHTAKSYLCRLQHGTMWRSAISAGDATRLVAIDSSIPFDADARRVFFRAMNLVTSRPLPAQPFAVPNILTYARIVAVPAVVACMYWQEILQWGLWFRWVALVIFVTAGVTDILDGYIARKWGEQSSFGRMLDPIADKLLVASCLFMLAADETIHGWSLLAAVVILCREILVSGLREYLAELRVSVPVTRLAKWKTSGSLLPSGFCWRARRATDPAGEHSSGSPCCGCRRC